MKLNKFLIISLIIASGCSRNDNNEFDFKDFKVPIKKIESVKDDLKLKSENKVENKLLPLEKRDEILTSIKYGKRDPFSSVESNANQFISYFHVKGFISLENKNYAIVEFLNQKGMINVNSIGGLNTNLLPNKAFVKKINPSQEEVELSVEDKIYTIKLSFD